MPQIRVLLGYQQGQVFSLDQRSLVIGRDPKSDIVLHPESAASRRHAEVSPVSGRWHVRDLGSVNGTALNGRRVMEEPLVDNDEIVVGDNVFVFENKHPDAAHIAEAASHTNLIDPKGLPNRPHIQALVHAMSERVRLVQEEVGRVVVGDTDLVRDLLTAILSRGHVLLTGMPGLAKTALVRTMSEALELRFRRIGFTPELQPADVTGRVVTVRDEKSGLEEPRFVPGPIFSHIVLADEINHTSPSTQASLLSVMNDYRVTVADQTHWVEGPFIVVATQTMQPQAGIHPLPDAQFDSFMFNLLVDHLPGPNGEPTPKLSVSPQPSSPRKVLTAKQVLELQSAVRELPVSDHVVRYAVRLVRATRPLDHRTPGFIKRYVHTGAGPRAAQYLILGAKARAVISGRLAVTLEDVRGVAAATLRHRIVSNFTAQSEGMDADKIVRQLIATVEEPVDHDA